MSDDKSDLNLGQGHGGQCQGDQQELHVMSRSALDRMMKVTDTALVHLCRLNRIQKILEIEDHLDDYEPKINDISVKFPAAFVPVSQD